MDKETKEFYEKHKDGDFRFDPIPSNINPKMGYEVGKWVIQQLLDNKLGWIDLDIKSVNPPDYEDFGFNFKIRLETDRVVQHTKQLPIGDVKGVTVYNNKWNQLDGADMTETAQWWFDNSACDTLVKVNYWRLEPNGYVQPHNFNIVEPTDNVDTLDLIAWPIPLMICMEEPGLDCHTVVEDFGIVPTQLGKVYLINPNKKRCIVNTGNSPSTRQLAHVRAGIQYQRVMDLLTRSYHRALMIQEKNDNNQG